MFRRLTPPAVYVTREAEQDDLCARRVERLLSAIDAPTIERDLDDEALAAIAEREGWRHSHRWGECETKADRPVVLNTLKFHHTPEQRAARLTRFPILRASRLHGYQGFSVRQDGEPKFRRNQGRICQAAYEFHTAFGCPFRCDYCPYCTILNVCVNIEAFLEHAHHRIRADRLPQTLYKWDNGTDVNALEPEYDATRLMVDFFARQKRDFLLLYTGKSDNVDFMLDYPHNGQTIVQWSLGARTQSTVFEEETAPWDKRVQAAAKCQQAGYPIRFRFSPILPVKGWREENRELIALIFQKTRPDVIALCMFGWMSYTSAAACLDLSRLDERFVEAMRAAEPWLADRKFGPLPHEARAEIYRFLLDEIARASPDTPVSLCLETPAMWTELGRRPPGPREPYPCVCGPYCTPGHPAFLPE